MGDNVSRNARDQEPTPSWKRSLSHLVSGTLASQGIQFIASLIVARLYTTGEFGSYASILASATVVATIITFSYQTAIPLAATREEARTLVWLSAGLAAFWAGLGALALWLMALTGTNPLGYETTWQTATFVPLTGFTLAMYATLRQWAARLSSFERIGRGVASGAFGQAGAQIALGWLNFGTSGLSIGFLSGRLLNLGILFGAGSVGRPPSCLELWAAAKRHSELPRWVMPTAVLNLIGTTAITPLVAHVYGDSTAGSFAFSMQMLSVPSALVGQAVSTILFPKLAQEDREGGVQPDHLQRYAILLGAVTIPAFLPFLLLGPELFGAFFGAEWLRAGEIAATLAPWFATSFVSGILSSFAIVKRRFRRVFVVGAVETITRVAAIIAGAALGGETTSFILYSSAGVAICLFSIGWALRLSGIDLSALLRTKWRAIVGSVCGFALLAIFRLVAPTGVVLVVAIVLTTLAGLRALKMIRQ